MPLVAQLRVGSRPRSRALGAVRPGEEVHPARDGHRAAVRVLPRRRDEHGADGPSGRRSTSSPRSSTGTGSCRRPAPSNVRREVRARQGSSVARVRPSASHSRAAVAKAPWAPAVTTTCSGVARTARDMPRYAASSARSRGSPSGQRYVVAGSGSEARSRQARGRSRSHDARTGTGRGSWTRSGSRTAAANGCPRRTAVAGPATPRAGRRRRPRTRARERARPEPAPEIGQRRAPRRSPAPAAASRYPSAVSCS